MAAERIAVHSVRIEDTPGSLQQLLAKVAESGVDLQGFVAYSTGQDAGRVCLAAKDPDALGSCLNGAGIEAAEMAGFIMEDDDRVGAAADSLKGLADAGISGVAGAAMLCGDKYNMVIMVKAEDGDAAADVL